MFKKIRTIFYKKGVPLKTKNLKFSYKKNTILKNINLTIKNNQILSIIGKSGEGKSTFLNLIVGVLTKKYEGSIKILGYENGLAKKDIGYVPQEISLIPDMNIEQNICFFGNLNGISENNAKKRGRLLMKTLHLNLPLTRFPREMSGGQKVRLNIVLSLIHNPKIIIMDEPFVGLDYFNRKILWHFLEYQKNRRKTIILTTHMLTEAENYSDKLIVLHKGNIIAKGKLEDICKKLNTRFISEIKFKYLSKQKEEKIINYCNNRNISLMDTFNNYYMFALKNQGQRNYLLKFIESLNVEYEEIGFRTPNLDEISLRVSNA